MFSLEIKSNTELLPVLLDGWHIGNVSAIHADKFVSSIWHLKITWENLNIPASLEIGYIPPTVVSQSHHNMQWPGIFFATTPSRFIRGVINLAEGGIEWIGPLE